MSQTQVMLIWYFSNNFDIHDYVGKLPKQHCSEWLFSNPGDKILFLLKFYEARISEWNITKLTNWITMFRICILSMCCSEDGCNAAGNIHLVRQAKVEMIGSKTQDISRDMVYLRLPLPQRSPLRPPAPAPCHG